jgi:D-citramalate synthase
VITWDYGKIFKTKGLDSDQTIAAMKATEKMLNIIEQLNKTNQEKLNSYGNEYSPITW